MIYCKTIFLTAVCLMMAFVSKAQDNNTMEKQQFSQDQNEVLNAVFEMTAALQKGNLDRVMASYEPNAQIVFEPGKPFSDPQLIRQMFQGFSSMKPEFVYSGHDVFVNDDIAIHIAPWDMTGTDPEGNQVKLKGLSVAILRKQADGKWLMVFDNPYGNALLEQK